MRLPLTVILLFLCYAVKAQTYLYNNDGISLSYQTTIVKNTYCDKEKKTVYFIKVNWTLNNNSGKDARIYYSIELPPPSVTWCTPQGVPDEVINTVLYYQRSGGGSPVILKSGEASYGQNAVWSFDMDITPRSGISYEFPQKGTTLKINVDLTPTAPKKPQPTYGISQQGDVVNNPKQQVNYDQKQQKEDAVTNNAMQAWKNSYQDNQNQINGINNTTTNIQQQQEKQRQLQQQQESFRQQQAQEKLNQVQQQLAEQQQRYQQTQIDFANAQSAADNAYQSAIASGKKESGAMLDATLAATEQISDATGQLTTLGVGLATSLFMHFAEKKQERLEREAAIRREEERKQAIINAKRKYISDAMNINKYGFADLISKQRYAALLITPLYNSPEEENIYFTIPVLVPKYADSTYALKDEVEKRLSNSLTLDKSLLNGMKVYTLYPITDVENFQDEFPKKMGSGHLILLKAHLLDFIKTPFSGLENNESTDFWGNPVKESTIPKPDNKKPTQNIFWNK